MDALARPEKEPKTPLAKRLREVRKALGDPDRSELAKALGVSVSTLAFYERGESEPTASVLSVYRTVYGINSDWMLTGQGEMYVDPTKAPANAGIRSINSIVFDEVGDLVAKVHAEEGVALPAKALRNEEASAYNALIERAENAGDTEELLSLIPWLEARIRKKLKAAQEAPGTGKRPA